MSKLSRPRTAGRYDLIGKEFRLAQMGTPASPNVGTTIVAVPNPNNPEHRDLVTVNRRTDILEVERRAGRISDG